MNSYNNHSQVEINNKWVINLSKTPLTKGKKSLLVKGPNFAIAPNKIPNVDYITAVESMCHKLKEEDAGNLGLMSTPFLEECKYPNPTLPSKKV